MTFSEKYARDDCLRKLQEAESLIWAIADGLDFDKLMDADREYMTQTVRGMAVFLTAELTAFRQREEN